MVSSSYHHGDLHEALLDEAMAVSREGGPAAIGMRELARALGVSPNAAYRHFADRDDLVRAAAARAQAALADTIREHLTCLPAGLEPARASVARLRLIGLGYIAFAAREPGWFTLAFTTSDAAPDPQVVTLDHEVVEPFQVLLDALDALVVAGVLAPEKRPYAEWPCWAAVHGFADIVAHGPLRHQPGQVVDALAEVVVDTAIAGVVAGPGQPAELTGAAGGCVEVPDSTQVAVDRPTR